MITLYTFGPAFGLPDPSLFVVKADVQLVDRDDRVVLELRGVEAHRLPEDTAFQPHKPAEHAPLA